MNKIKHYYTFFVFLMLLSCGLKPISSEYIFVDSSIENISLEGLGNGKILIHNGSNVFHKIDATSSLNIWINDKPLGQLKASEFVIVNLNDGDYSFKLLHKDVFNMRSEHTLQINDDVKVIMVKPTITSNKLEITNEFPRNWEKFNYKIKN